MSLYAYSRAELSKHTLHILTSAQVLNVQVPFFFKTIVDSMNIDFLTHAGTVWTAAGAVILACTSPPPPPLPPPLPDTPPNPFQTA